MYRVLLICYSQSGDVARIAGQLIASIAAQDDVHLEIERIRPVQTFPSPWRSVRRFFDVMPECIVGIPAEIEDPAFDPSDAFDLVIIAYPVWFLAPALPIQGFFASAHSKVLDGARVVTLSVSRNMWHSASESMKQMLNHSSAKHVGNVAITHQGPAWATFISTPRALLFGKRDSLWGIFPPVGFREEDLARVRRLGEVIAQHIGASHDDELTTMLRECQSAPIERRFVVPELLGWHLFRCCGGAVLRMGRFGKMVRGLAVYMFAVSLVFFIVFGVPLTIAAAALLHPLIRNRLEAYIKRLSSTADNRLE